MRENLKLMLKQVQNLNSLDLSYWNSVRKSTMMSIKTTFFQVGRLRSLRPHFFSLTTLTLHDVPNLSNALDNICLLTELKSAGITQLFFYSNNFSSDCWTFPRVIGTLVSIRGLRQLFTN